jgi:ABC-type uncharacterized transport system substrate-binding protein
MRIETGSLKKPSALIAQHSVLCVALGAMLFALCHPAEAQQSVKVPRIGLLISARPSIASPRIQAFQRGLRDLGYVEGKHIILEYRYAEGNVESVSDLAADLVRRKVDIIVTDTSNATQAAKDATKLIPIVFTTANDPVGDGQVDSLARPGGNLTGLSILALDLNGKRLEILKEAFPSISRVGFLTGIGSATGEQRLAKRRLWPKGWACSSNILAQRAAMILKMHSTQQNGPAFKLCLHTRVLLWQQIARELLTFQLRTGYR